MRFRRLAATLMVAGSMLSASGSLAVQPDEVLSDPKLEARARAISAGLRCLVCQNQSIDDSDAPLAKDLRILVRDRLTAGASDADVRSYVVQRYGEFVLLRPSFTAQTALLWLAPILILGAGSMGVVMTLRRRRQNRTIPGLSAAEQDAVQRLLRENGP